jgi:hypothetical protein
MLKGVFRVTKLERNCLSASEGAGDELKNGEILEAFFFLARAHVHQQA